MKLLAAPVLLALSFPAQAQPTPEAPLARLHSNIDRITKSVNADWGVYIKCLETNEEIAINADRQMDTLSVIKLPLLVEAFRQIEAGKFSLDDRVTLKDSDKRPGTGIIRSLKAGAVLSLQDLLTLMIIVSDNTATDLIFDKVGGIESVNELAKSYRLTNTRAMTIGKDWFEALAAAPSRDQFHAEGKHPFGLSSAGDMGKLLEMLERGQAVSKPASDQMLDMLRAQVYSSRLPKYVTGFRVPHKTGDFLPYVANDVGVLEGPNRTVIISIFTAHHYGIGANLEDAIARVAEQTANYFAFRNAAP